MRRNFFFYAEHRLCHRESDLERAATLGQMMCRPAIRLRDTLNAQPPGLYLVQAARDSFLTSPWARAEGKQPMYTGFADRLHRRGVQHSTVQNAQSESDP